MELILKRTAKCTAYTIGNLYIRETINPDEPGTPADKYFCDTLEPTWRNYAGGQYKIAGRSAIPEGRYAVVITLSPKFQEWLPQLLGGPKFNHDWKGVRIHAGNTASDTAGCILVGRNRRKGMVLDSRHCLNRLIGKIVQAKNRGEGVWITIV
jgi:hypothetical protein